MHKRHNPSVYASVVLSLLAVALFISVPTAAAADYDFAVITDSDSYDAMSTVKIRIKNTGARTLSLRNM